MKKLNAKELFELLYDEKITEDECIEVLHPEEKDHFILRNSYWNEFDKDELFGCLLFKEYKFAVRNQKKIEKYLEKKDKEEKIAKLEKELERLKNVD